MRRHLILVAVWLVGLAAGRAILAATACRPVPFDPADRMVLSSFGDGPLVAVARWTGTEPNGLPLFAGPVAVWDLDAGRQVAAHVVAPAGGRFKGWASGRWLRVRPVGPDGAEGPPALFDLTDGREVCRADAETRDWGSPVESAGRVVIQAVDGPTGRCFTTGYDPATGAAAWSADGCAWLTTDRHVVTCTFNDRLRAPPAGPLVVRASADGTVVGTVPTAVRPLATDGAVLLTGDGSVWDVAAGRVRFRLPGLEPTTAELPGHTPDGRSLVVGQQTPAGPAVCWFDSATGVEVRRVSVPTDAPQALVTVRGRVVSARCGEWPKPELTDRLRDWLPLVPRPVIVLDMQTRVYRFEADTGQRLADGHPLAVVERPDGRPLLTADNSLRPAWVWADRPSWLFHALAAGWTCVLFVAACLVRRQPALGSAEPPPRG